MQEQEQKQQNSKGPASAAEAAVRRLNKTGPLDLAVTAWLRLLLCVDSDARGCGRVPQSRCPLQSAEDEQQEETSRSTVSTPCDHACSLTVNPSFPMSGPLLRLASAEHLWQ